MWFMNKLVNPLIRLILRSPLGSVWGAAPLLITYRGRKSGQEYTLPVQYAPDGNTLYIIVGMPEQKTWWRNLRGGAPVQVTLRGKTRPGYALLLQPDTDREAMVRGMELYLGRFPSMAGRHQVQRESDGRLNAADLERAATRVRMIRVEVNG